MCHMLELSNVGYGLVSYALCIEILGFYTKKSTMKEEGTACMRSHQQGP